MSGEVYGSRVRQTLFIEGAVNSKKLTNTNISDKTAYLDIYQAVALGSRPTVVHGIHS